MSVFVFMHVVIRQLGHTFCVGLTSLMFLLFRVLLHVYLFVWFEGDAAAVAVASAQYIWWHEVFQAIFHAQQLLFHMA